MTDFTNSLLSLADEYRRFIIKRDGTHASEEVRLYIKNIQSGSIVTDLVAYAPLALPIFEYTNTIIEFGGYLKGVVNYFLGNSNQESNLEKINYENISHSIEPIAKDKRHN